MKTARDWLQDPNLFSTSALVLLTDAWGTDFLDWDPASVEIELGSTFGIDPSPELLDRVQAAAALFSSNLFFLSLETFTSICNALNFGVVSSEVFLPADLDDVMWGVSEAKVLLGDIYEETEFSHNVARYVGHLLSEEGISDPPPALKFAEMGDTASSVDPAAFSDEVEAQVYYSLQDEEKKGLEANNNGRLLSLFQQISRLPLKHGDVGPIKDRLAQVLRQASLG